MPSTYPEKPRRPLTPAERSRFHLRSLGAIRYEVDCQLDAFPEDDLSREEMALLKRWCRVTALYLNQRQKAARVLGVYFAEVR